MIIVNILGVLFLFFFLWKRLKEDYHYEKIFNLAVFVTLGFLVSFFISKQFLSDYWFWIELAGISIGFVIGIIKLKLKFFESLDGLVIGILPWLGLYFLVNAINSSSLISFLSFWSILILIFVFFFLDSHYRRFVWYKSGRVGFAGVATLILFFLSRIIFTFGTIEAYFSGTFAFLFFLVLCILTRKEN